MHTEPRSDALVRDCLKHLRLNRLIYLSVNRAAALFSVVCNEPSEVSARRLARPGAIELFGVHRRAPFAAYTHQI